MKTDNARISDWVWEQSMSPAEKLVSLALLRFRNNETGLCYPSQSTLAKWTGLSRSGVQKAIRGLRLRGLLEASGHAGQTNRYSLKGAHSVSTTCSLSKHKPNSNQSENDFTDADLQDRAIRRAGGKKGLMWDL
jgi:DNA-binding transcriptional MocR family regulator